MIRKPACRHARGPRAAALVPLFALAAPALAADRFWVGPDGASWSDGANWSLTLGGPGGAGVPVVGDNAIVDVPTSRGLLFDHAYDAPGVGVTLNPRGANPPTALAVTQSDPASRLTVAGDLRIARGTGGFGSTGTTLFTQNAGAVHVGGTLRVENLPLMHPPEYRFNGGTLTANAVLINGNFRQTGGHMEVADNLAVNFTDAPGVAAFSGGTLLVQNVISPGLGRIGFGGAAVTAAGLGAGTGLGSPTAVGISAGTLSLGTVNFQGTWTQTGGATTIGSGSFHRGGIIVSGGSLTAANLLITTGIMPGFFRQTGGESDITHFTVQAGTAEFNGGAMTVGTLSGGLSIGADGPERLLRLRAYEGGGLRVNDNAVAVDYDGGSLIEIYRAHLGAGRIVGPAGTSHGLAYAEASAIATVPAIFGTVDATTLLFRAMRYGDADWNGIVNLSDFNRLAANFGRTNQVWTDGDFDYNGFVNLQDFNRLAANFGLRAAGTDVTPQDWADLAAAIPEPASGLAVGSLVMMGCMCRRRPRRG